MLALLAVANAVCCKQVCTILECPNSGCIYGPALCCDGTSPSPYCGYGSCNMFGCNCDGGCRGSNNDCVVNPGCLDNTGVNCQTTCPYSSCPTTGTCQYLSNYGRQLFAGVLDRVAAYGRQSAFLLGLGEKPLSEVSHEAHHGRQVSVCQSARTLVFNTINTGGSGAITLTEAWTYLNTTLGAISSSVAANIYKGLLGRNAAFTIDVLDPSGCSAAAKGSKKGLLGLLGLLGIIPLVVCLCILAACCYRRKLVLAPVHFSGGTVVTPPVMLPSARGGL